jgi:hypothetical protein
MHQITRGAVATYLAFVRKNRVEAQIILTEIILKNSEAFHADNDEGRRHS